MTPFVKTPFGLMPESGARRVEQALRDHEARRKESTEEDVARRAHAIGLKVDEVRRLWIGGPEIVQRAVRNAIANIPAHVLERAYKCSACKTIKDDRYKADCKARAQVPCFVTARLRGCDRFERAPIVSGATTVR